jgi:hypothetical protein
MFPLYFGLLYMMKSAAKQARVEGPLQVNRSTIWKLRVGIIVLLLLLANGIWHYRHGPFLPVFVSAAMNLFFTGTLIRLLMRIQRKAR